MKRFLFFSVAVAAVSALSAQEPLPDAVRLLDQQWRGDWRTVQYVLESPSGSLTVAIEKPQRLRAELKSREGWSLTVVSNGESTWVYNSDVKRYARFDGSRPPEAWLFRLDELLLRHMTGARDDVLTPRWRDLRTRGTESVRVLGTPRESWMVQGFAFDLGGEWSKRTVWIDKDLLIPIQLATALNEQPLYARVRSLRVDQPIPSSTFMFAAPRGATEVPAPSHLLSTSSSDSLPDGQTLWDQRWTGPWRTIQYTTEASSPLVSSPSVRKVIRTVVTIEKPDRLRIELQGLEGDIQGSSFAGRTVTVVSDGEAAWIYNSSTRQYARLSKSQRILPPAVPVLGAPGSQPARLSYVPVLSNVTDWATLQILASYRIFQNPELFKDLREINEPIFEPTRWVRRITLRSESIDVAGTTRDCWVVLGEGYGVPLWFSRVAWIDKELKVPLLFGVVTRMVGNTARVAPNVFPEEQPFDAKGYEPDFAGMRVLSLKVDVPIPPGTFTFKPPNGAIEVTPSERAVTR